MRRKRYQFSERRRTNQPKIENWKEDGLNNSELGHGLTGTYKKFGSPEEFADACQEAGVDFSESSWRSGESASTALNLVRQGDESRVEKAQALVDQFASEVDLGTMFPTWEADVCGAYPNVPNFLAGVPETMMRKQLVTSERAPVTMWVCVTSSGGVEARQMEARGIAIQALAMALSQTRQITLRIFSGLDGAKGNHIVSVDLPSPAVLSQSAYMIASQGFSRGLTYKYLDTTGAGGGWPQDVEVFGSFEERCQSWRRLLPMESQDLIFPHVFFEDQGLSDPIGHCKAIFEKIMAGERGQLD